MFNVADSAVSVGVFLLACFLLLYPEEKLLDSQDPAKRAVE